jgi:AsmA-like protein
MTRRKWLRWILVVCLTPILLVLVILLSSPLWINQDAVKREVTKLISNATGGKAQFERIELHLLPFPGVGVSRLRFSEPGKFEVETESAAVDMRFLPLLFGNVYPHRVEIASPQVRIHLEEPKPSSQPQAQSKPFSLKDTEASVRAVLAQIEKTVPGLAAEIKAGQVTLQIGQRPPLLIDHLDLHFDATAGTVAAKLSCTSNLFEHLAAEVHVASKDLFGDGHLELAGVQVPSIGPILGIQEGWPVQEANVNLKLKFQMRGLGDAHADVNVDTPKVSLQLGKGHLEFTAPALEATAQTKGASAEVVLTRLAIVSPRITASARFAVSEASGYALESEATDIDLPALQAAADGLAPAVDFLQDFPVRFARGTVTTVKFNTQAAMLGDLFDLKALHINGVVNDVDLSLPVLYNLKVYEASAIGSLEQGIVRAQQVRGRLEKSTGRDGTFEMDLNPDVPPLRAELTVMADLPEALAVAKRVIPDADAQKALGQVKQLQGSASVHAMLGGDVNNVVPRVEVSAIKASARHDLVPFPIRVAGGAVIYADNAVSVQGLDGAIGESTFTGVGARLSLGTPTVLTSQQGSVLLALDQLFGWAAAQPQFAKPLEGVKSVSGGLAVSIAQLDLPLNAPDQVRFQVSATPVHIAIDAPRYGPRVQLDGGAVGVSQQSVSANGVKASALDAVLTLSGSTDNYRQGIGGVQAGATGSVGLEALKWIYARAELPRALRLRAALTVSEANLNWRQGAGVAANGKVNVVGGPAIGFAVRSIPKRLEVEKFTVRDDVSDLTFGGSLEGGHFTAAYKGKLAGSSIDRTFAEPLISLEQLQGDFRADGNLKRPDATRATGVLQGSKIRLPPALPVPVMIEKLSLEAKDTVLLVKSATVSSGESQVSVSGNVTYLKDKFAVDADVKGDKIVIPKSREKSETEDSSKPASESPSLTGNAEEQHKLLAPLWEIPVSGTVRVDIGQVQVDELQIAPLIGSVSLETGHLHLGLKRAALCAITLSGEVLIQPDDADAEVKLSARGAQLDKSIACLTQQRLQITGKLDMDGAFSARGKLGTLLDHMKGTFAATASDGHINKFDNLAAVLKVVNVTQAIAGELPDLNKGGMDYKSARVKGQIEGHKILFQEFALDASALTVAAHGNVDYATKAIDMTVLVAPFKTVTWVVQHIPILRGILGGMLIAVPVQVHGTVDKPIVVPLGPTAVGSRLLDILGNTLKLPGQAINLVAPPASEAPQPATPTPATSSPR